MTEPVRISDRDVRALLRIVTGEREHDVAEGLPLSLLEDLNEQIPCDIRSFFGLNSRQETAWFSQDLAADEGQDDQAFWTHYWDSEPCSYPDRSGDLRSVTKISDFCSSRQWHATGMSRDYLRGVEHEIMVCLPAAQRGPVPPGRSGLSVRPVRVPPS